MGNEVYEYTVNKKSEGRHKLARALMIGFYVAFFIGMFTAVMLSNLYPLFAVAPTLLWIIVLCTWRFVSIEYKYTVEAGMLTLTTVYGGKTKRSKGSYHIKDAKAFMPLGAAKDEIARFGPSMTVDFLSSARSPSDPYAFMIEADGKRVLILIEVPVTSKKAILYYATDSLREMANK